MLQGNCITIDEDSLFDLIIINIQDLANHLVGLKQTYVKMTAQIISIGILQNIKLAIFGIIVASQWLVKLFWISNIFALLLMGAL